MRFRRPCRLCEEMFRPTGSSTKLCDRCRKIRRIEGALKAVEIRGYKKNRLKELEIELLATKFSQQEE